jgi:predicted RNA binding protein with dsRBD fold (UPF0201 family)
MSCFLSSTRQAQLTADLDRVNSQLEKLYTSYDSAIENSEIEEYSFNSMEGSQRTTRRKPEEILKSINVLEAKRDQITKKLNGTGLVNMNLRRL